MFSWLRRLFKPEERFDVYLPKERLIYRYFDGSKQVNGDPLILYKRMMDKGPEMSIDMKLAVSISKDASLGHDKLVAKIREIFKIKPVDEGGLTEQEAIELLNHFLIYTEWLKKNSRASVTSSTSTVASNYSFPEGPPTLNSSDSGSTENASKIEDRELLHSAST